MKTATLLAGTVLCGALAIGLHVVVARAIKITAWSIAPLSAVEPETVRYERRVYATALAPMQQIVALVVGSGLLFGVGVLAGPPSLILVAALCFIAGLALDLARWERVALGTRTLWFQRGIRGRVHQVPIENIGAVSIAEEAGRGFTLRRGTANRLVRLCVRLHDQRQLPLARTDAYSSRRAVRRMARRLNVRLQQLRDRGISQELMHLRRKARAAEAAQAMGLEP